MPEPKRLMPAILDLAFKMTYVEGSGNVNMLRDIRGHIAAQDAELETARGLLRELVADKLAGRGPWQFICHHCHTSDRPNGTYPHAPDCPIVRGREWLGEAADA